jgi:predicted alpha-1,2-mannosidase
MNLLCGNQQIALSFGNQTIINVRIGTSFTSPDNALKNLEYEVPHWEFDKLRRETEEVWNQTLGKVRPGGGTEENMIKFYTAIYHCYQLPRIVSDIDGSYPGFAQDTLIHRAEGFDYYDDFSMWDTFRALHPLMTLIDEKRSTQWANNLLLKYRQGGFLPKWPLAASYTGTMIAYPAVAVLTDALTKEIPGIDRELALEAALLSASWQEDLDIQEGNPRVDMLMPLHNKYLNMDQPVPADLVSGSVSYGLEMAYYDWCISRLAALCEKDSLERHFRERSVYYKLYFDESSGFMRGRNSDGTWLSPFNPRYSDHEHSPYVEGNAWQWSWFVPHDLECLEALFGLQ